MPKQLPVTLSPAQRKGLEIVSNRRAKCSLAALVREAVERFLIEEGALEMNVEKEG